MIIVISKKYETYKSYLIANNIGIKDAVFVNKKERLMGFRNVKIVELDHISELQPYIEIIKAKNND